MSGDLFSLLSPGSKSKPKPPRAPARTNPRPSYDPVRGGGDLFNLMTPGSKNAPKPPAPIAPIAQHQNTISHDPNTGRVRKLSYPVQGYRISTPFGPRIHPITGRASNHTGMDLAVGMGTPIYAPRKGVVEQAVSGDSIYGNQVIMRNGPNLETMYGHMEKFAVEPGQELKRGDLIGYVGSTGLSTGPHLHWETWKNGQPVNPANLADPDLPRRIPKALQVPKMKPGELPDMSDDHDSDLMRLLNRAISQSRRQGGPAPQAPSGGPGRSPQLQAFLRGISDQESGGNYNAVGVDTGGGHRAYGKYQIMDFNIEGPDGWDQEALGRNIDIQEFLNNPKIQEKIARAKLASYFKQYGPSGAAKAWYAGPGNANTNSNAPQYGGPSINSYADSVINHMQNYL